MADNDIAEDQQKLKQGLVKVLECVAAISSAAAVVNPIFGVAGSLIRVVLHQVEVDKDIQALRHEFSRVNQGLDTISKQNHNILHQIQKETMDQQFSKVEWNLRSQFRKFMEVVEARPEYKERKRAEFEECYSRDGGDQNLQSLYENVTGVSKIFSRPILKVYMTYSQGDRKVMEHLCTRLTYLFCIGLIALMGYTAIIGDDEESMNEQWIKQMVEVQDRMQEVLRMCK